MLTGRLLFCALAVTALVSGTLVHPVRADGPKQLSLAEAPRVSSIDTELTGNCRDHLQLVIKNKGAAPVEIILPAGFICSAGKDERVITLRASTFPVPPNGTAVAEIPVAALSLKNGADTVPFVPTNETEPKLTSLLALIAARNEMPRATAQLAVLALLENVTFSDWQRFLNSPASSKGQPATTVVQAIDALGLLREISPDQDFALAKDNELKIRALRDPLCRTKAARLFGLAELDQVGGAAQTAPDLKQLLHTQPGDNCPICRMRQQVGRGAGDL